MLRPCLPQWPLRWDGLRIHNQGCNEHRATSSGLVLRETFFSCEGQALAKPGRFTVYGRGPESFSSPPLYRRRPNGDFIFINHETKQQTKHHPKAFLGYFGLIAFAAKKTRKKVRKCRSYHTCFKISLSFSLESLPKN